LLRHLPTSPTLPVLDLGCGTGHFAAALADWLDATVIGIDPAREMLRVASPAGPRGRIAYALGLAEAIPLGPSTCDFAWLSTVIHHFDDLPRAAAELRRVLRPGAAVFIRNWFPGRAEITYFPYFPSAKRMAETFPTIAAVETAFASSGFHLQALDPVTQVSAPGLRVFCERMRSRADTTLQALSDQEFADGMRRLEEDAAAETEPQPVTTTLDLMVLR
jgi:SAM-dependent methyltransferase